MRHDQAACSDLEIVAFFSLSTGLDVCLRRCPAANRGICDGSVISSIEPKKTNVLKDAGAYCGGASPGSKAGSATPPDAETHDQCSTRSGPGLRSCRCSQLSFGGGILQEFIEPGPHCGDAIGLLLSQILRLPDISGEIVQLPVFCLPHAAIAPGALRQLRSLFTVTWRGILQ